MKVKVQMKDPDTLYDAINDAVSEQLTIRRIPDRRDRYRGADLHCAACSRLAVNSSEGHDMSKWSEHREREREFESEVFYEAWRAGINPDRAVECASDCYWDGKTPQECVEDHAKAIRRARDEESEFFDPDAM